MVDKLPGPFLTFATHHGIDPNIYFTFSPKQYFWLLDEDARELIETDHRFSKDPDLGKLFKVEVSDFRFTTCELYVQAKIIPLDKWSAVAVTLLQPTDLDHFLDVCCAPGIQSFVLSLGAKLILAAHAGFKTVTGVDLSHKRLCTTRSMVKKYAKNLPIRLFLEDARYFREKPLDPVVLGTSISKALKTPVPSYFYAQSSFRKQPCLSSDDMYDKILVDVQCTHDGSLKHVQKNIANSWVDFDWNEIESSSLLQLYMLQVMPS